MQHAELTITTGSDRFTDLTDRLADFAREHGGDGLVNVWVPHATAGIAVFETGAGSEPDLSRVIDEVLPRDDRWQHSHGSTGHGADHVLPALIAPSITIPVRDGRPLLGTWQSVVLVDTNSDNRSRTVHLALLAETPAGHADG